MRIARSEIYEPPQPRHGLRAACVVISIGSRLPGRRHPSADRHQRDGKITKSAGTRMFVGILRFSCCVALVGMTYSQGKHFPGCAMTTHVIISPRTNLQSEPLSSEMPLTTVRARRSNRTKLAPFFDG